MAEILVHSLRSEREPAQSCSIRPICPSALCARLALASPTAVLLSHAWSVRDVAIVMRRGPVLPGVDDEHVASLGRELMRALGHLAPEPWPGPSTSGAARRRVGERSSPAASAGPEGLPPSTKVRPHR